MKVNETGSAGICSHGRRDKLIAELENQLQQRVAEQTQFCLPMEDAMKRTQALKLLAESKPILAARYGVRQIGLFGSTVRNSARRDSDIDVLVSFEGPATSERYFGVQFFLEDLFGTPVDLVTDKALRPELRPFIEKETVHV